MKFTPDVFDPTPIPIRPAVVSSEMFPVSVRTPQQQWAYALRFDRAGGDPPGFTGMLIVRVQIEVTVGSLGIGCLDTRGAAFLDERIVNAGGGPVEVELLAGTPSETGPLIVRNASSAGPSDGVVLAIACYEASFADDSTAPRHPPLSDPPVMPGWSRCYGSQGLTLVERLRARSFEKQQGPRVLQWTDGTTFELEDDQLSRALFVSGTYEPNTMNVLRRLLHDGDTFIDVGANAGAVSLAASRWVGAGLVLSIEPSAREFRRLTHNIETNGITNVQAFQVAVASRPGTVNLRIAGDAHGGLNTLGGSFPYEGVEALRSESVEATTLDDFLTRHRIERVAAVKLDIEGAEGEALTGAQRMLTKMRPPLVIEVFSRSLEAQGWTRERLAELVRRADYVTYRIDDATGGLVLVSGLDTVDEQNIFAMPREFPAASIDVHS